MSWGIDFVQIEIKVMGSLVSKTSINILLSPFKMHGTELDMAVLLGQNMMLIPNIFGKRTSSVEYGCGFDGSQNWRFRIEDPNLLPLLVLLQVHDQFQKNVFISLLFGVKIPDGRYGEKIVNSL